MKKFRIIAPAVVLAALALFIYFRFYFVFGEGVKSGELNYVVVHLYIVKQFNYFYSQAWSKTDLSLVLESVENVPSPCFAS